jgi:acetyl esterase/lipase
MAYVTEARAFVAQLRAVTAEPVVFAELPAAQHAFDVFPSIRSAHIVRAIDRYLHWHWNQYRREREQQSRTTEVVREPQ